MTRSAVSRASIFTGFSCGGGGIFAFAHSSTIVSAYTNEDTPAAPNRLPTAKQAETGNTRQCMDVLLRLQVRQADHPKIDPADQLRPQPLGGAQIGGSLLRCAGIRPENDNAADRKR